METLEVKFSVTEMKSYWMSLITEQLARLKLSKWEHIEKKGIKQEQGKPKTKQTPPKKQNLNCLQKNI